VFISIKEESWQIDNYKLMFEIKLVASSKSRANQQGWAKLVHEIKV